MPSATPADDRAEITDLFARRVRGRTPAGRRSSEMQVAPAWTDER